MIGRLRGVLAEVEAEAVVLRLVEKCCAGSGQQRGALIDLVERIRRDHHRRRPGAIDDRLGDREQRLARAVDR
jgi:hypothetical protein